MRNAGLLGYRWGGASSLMCVYVGHNSGLNFSTACRNRTQADLTVWVWFGFKNFFLLF